jgi:hypothetical protein
MMLYVNHAHLANVIVMLKALGYLLFAGFWFITSCISFTVSWPNIFQGLITRKDIHSFLFWSTVLQAPTNILFGIYLLCMYLFTP